LSRNPFPALFFGFHAHNDCGLAVANSIAAVQAGAKMIHGTIKWGNGESAVEMQILFQS